MSAGAASALVVQNGDTAPAGLLGDWMRERGIPFDVHVAGSGEPPRVADRLFVASLGSRHGANDVDVPLVAAARELVAEAVERDVPVLGLCFGGQMLASVLGGRVEPAPVPELGWHTVDTRVPDEIPVGPWLQWHYQRFHTPPGADELATSPAGSQAFRSGPHLGVQFHPETTIDIVRSWARADLERASAAGQPDPVGALERGRHHAAAAAAAAFRLFDAFLRRARA